MLVDSEGCIHFPKKGDPPQLTLTNYVQDPGDPYRWNPAFPPCKKRLIELKVMPCGKEYRRFHCHLGTVSPVKCIHCTEIEKPTE